MRGAEISSALVKLRSDEHSFVKWWRKENDFLDYDLIDRFMDNINHAEEIEGFELLTLDEMWQRVEQVCGSRVNLVHSGKGDQVEWTYPGKSGTHHEVCIYSPETVMSIFDIETKGNPVC
ncbi:MAG: hypothetical protein HXX17_06235 [Geobacteraceae bacterium]|nr:hypothetical protein [Geobacteraceae bacterium]